MSISRNVLLRDTSGYLNFVTPPVTTVQAPMWKSGKWSQSNTQNTHHTLNSENNDTRTSAGDSAMAGRRKQTITPRASSMMTVPSRSSSNVHLAMHQRKKPSATPTDLQNPLDVLAQIIGPVPQTTATAVSTTTSTTTTIITKISSGRGDLWDDDIDFGESSLEEYASTPATEDSPEQVMQPYSSIEECWLRCLPIAICCLHFDS